MRSRSRSISLPLTRWRGTGRGYAQRSAVALLLAWAFLATAAAPRLARADFVAFESGQVRPLGLSPSGGRLFAVNTPDNALEVFDVGADGLAHAFSVPVGLEPVAVAARSETEVWVVNHLSDSVSVVDLAGAAPRVAATLLVGDEPRDVVFAGEDRGRAFVTAAHRGQSRPGDPQLTTPGVGRADVWVFDAAARGPAPIDVVTLFGDTPRALAASPDGSRVYAAIFHSGNETTSVGEDLVCDGGTAAPPCAIAGTALPGGVPGPNVDAAGTPAPETGLIVKHDRTTGAWSDGLGRDWRDAVRFTLPDLDVFAIDAASLAVERSWAHVGTVLFNLAVNPASGRVYASNTEARNDVRFEGDGLRGGSTVRGRAHAARITVLDPDGGVRPRHLNKHIDYDAFPAPASVRERSLATPLGMAVSGDGSTLYVAAFGSSRVGVFATASLEDDSFVPAAGDHIPLAGGGPSGLALDEARGRLYVLTRFDNSVSVVELASRDEVQHLALHDPEPESVTSGRPLLYDARFTSSNGEASCAGCHVFGDVDGLAWDLGNPDAVAVPNPNPIHFGIYQDFHPLKGPMATQSLRGLAAHGPMHWRGDRTGGTTGGDPLAEDLAFIAFNAAFPDLLGRAAPLGAPDMLRLTQFVLQVRYPPNPVRALDGVLTPAQQRGRDLYFGRATDGDFACNGCHTLAPSFGYFGSDGQTASQGGTQLFKIPHLRNLYQKVGMFGRPTTPEFAGGESAGTGPQVRGFGFQHDASIDTLARFHSASPFTLTAYERLDLEQFLLAFDSNFAPATGQQVTIGLRSASAARLELLAARAAAGECDLVAKGVLEGLARGWLREADGRFASDRASEPRIELAALRAQAETAAQELTFTCVPAGSGRRIGIDRDDDSFPDRDELDAGTDPADPTSRPAGPTPTPVPDAALVRVRTSALRLQDDLHPGGRRTVWFKSTTADDPAANRVVPPARGDAADPRQAGAILRVFGAGGTSDSTTYALPAAGWRALGGKRRHTGYAFRGKKGAPIAMVSVANDRIGVRGSGSYTLNEPAQGRVAVELRFAAGAAGRGWCAEAPARRKGQSGSTEKTDRRGRFEGEPESPPPAACATPP